MNSEACIEPRAPVIADVSCRNGPHNTLFVKEAKSVSVKPANTHRYSRVNSSLPISAPIGNLRSAPSSDAICLLVRRLLTTRGRRCHKRLAMLLITL